MKIKVALIITLFLIFSGTVSFTCAADDYQSDYVYWTMKDKVSGIQLLFCYDLVSGISSSLSFDGIILKTIGGDEMYLFGKPLGDEHISATGRKLYKYSRGSFESVTYMVDVLDLLYPYALILDNGTVTAFVYITNNWDLKMIDSNQRVTDIDIMRDLKEYNVVGLNADLDIIWEKTLFESISEHNEWATEISYLIYVSQFNDVPLAITTGNTGTDKYSYFWNAFPDESTREWLVGCYLKQQGEIGFDNTIEFCIYDAMTNTIMPFLDNNKQQLSVTGLQPLGDFYISKDKEIISFVCCACEDMKKEFIAVLSVSDSSIELIDLNELGSSFVLPDYFNCNVYMQAFLDCRSHGDGPR